MEKAPLILSEADNLTAVGESLKQSKRVKYTCFAVSENHLIFGASSGGLYIFHREPCSFIQLLPSTNGSVTHVSISPCESLVAFSTIKGSVSIVEFQSTSAPRFKRTSYEHEGSIIGALQWSARSSELYIGDNTGRVSVLSLLFYMGQSMFQLSHVSLMQLDSSVVQMDWHYHLLLVSTLSRSYLCDTVHQQYRQIGSQLRDGPYGACFHNVGDEDLSVADVDRDTTRSSTQFSSLREGERLLADDRLRSVKIYCARPGLRLWEVRVDGTVLNTLQLKRALAVPAVPVISFSTSSAEPNDDSNATSQQPFNFAKLCRAVDDKFLLAFHSGGFYLLDPGVNGLVIWSDSISGIAEVKTVRDTVYLWCKGGRLRAVNVCELDTLVVRLYIEGRFGACASLVTNHKDYFTSMLKESPKFQFLSDLTKKLRENSVVVSNEVTTFLDSLAFELNQEKRTALKLDSGIFLVGNDFSLNYNVSQPKAQTYSYRDALLRKQTDSNRRNGYDISLKVESDTRASSRDSSDVESSADDLDDVFQLLGITKQEMKIALKEMGNTITGTLTNSTKSVKKSLRVMMSRQKLPWASNYWNTPSPGGEDEGELKVPSDGRRKPLEEWKEAPNTRVNDFILACEKVSNYKASDEKCQEDYVFDFLKSLVDVCYQYGALTSDEVSGILLGRRNEPNHKVIEVSDIFSEWLLKGGSSIFTFSPIFSEDVVVQIRIHLHNSLKSGSLVAWIRKNLPDVRESSLLFPSFMRNLFNEVDFLVDRILSHFLKTTASLLDPFIILQCLSVCQASCIFASWSRVLELCQEGKLHRDRNTFEGVDKDQWPLPITLNAILIMLDLKQVEYCKSAPIKDIFYTILRLETRGLRNGKSESAVFEECGSLFMEYLGGLFSSKITECLDDTEIRTYLLIHFERMECFKNKLECCPCGLPQPFPNDELGKRKLPYSKVCRSMVKWLSENDKDKLTDLCQSYPLLRPLALSMRRNDSLETLLPIIIQMDEFFEMEFRIDEMTEDLWSRVFVLCSDLGQNKCLGCSTPLKNPLDPADETMGCASYRRLWKRLAEFLIRKLGPAEGTRLLRAHVDLIPRGVLDDSFLKLCAVSTLIDPTSSSLSKYVLDLILDVPQKIPLVSAFSSKVVEKLDKSDIAAEMEPSLSRNHHWGVKIHLEGGTCPCCLLPLGSSILVKQGGIAVFKCAHVFHTVCLRKQTSTLKKSGCPVCPKRSAN